MSMKALAFRATGDEQVLELRKVARPIPGAEDVLIKVQAFAINPVDPAVRSGAFPALPITEATIVGWDGSGVVEALGSNVSTFNIGDEVYFSGSLQRPGAYAEYTLVNHELLAIKPKTVDHVVAASMPLTALTALQAFEKRLHLSIPVTDADIKAAAAKSILITAGAGGVGSIAIQLAKRVYKLGTVIATASRADSIAWCKDQGADIVIDRSGDWTSQLTSHGINSVDLFLVCSQFEGMEESILSLASQGAFICGIAPTQVNINLGRVFYKALSIGFLFMLPIGHGTHLKLLASLVDDGAIKPWIGKKYDIATEETIREGHKALSTGATIGKISYAAIFP